MEPLNNQPNSLFVCRVRAFSVESRLNIGWRVGTRTQEGLSSPWYCFFLCNQDSTSPEQVATPCSGSSLGFCLTGSFAHFTLLRLFGRDRLFRVAVLECVFSVSAQATVSSLKLLMVAACHYRHGEELFKGGRHLASGRRIQILTVCTAVSLQSCRHSVGLQQIGGC